MIKDIVGSGPFVQVIGGGGYSPYINMSNPSAGMTRWNGATQSLEVYDGSSWMVISSSVTSVGLTGDAVSAITWAKKKMEEEAELEKLAREHPAVNIALDNLKKAKIHLDTTIILSKEHDQKTTS
jgi:hypothetical protein